MHRQPMIARQDREHSEMMERHLESGRRLHDQAIVDFFVWMVFRARLSIRNACGSTRRLKGHHAGPAGRIFKRRHRIPV